MVWASRLFCTTIEIELTRSNKHICWIYPSPISVENGGFGWDSLLKMD